MGKGSGSVTTFSGADGFITIDQHTETMKDLAYWQAYLYMMVENLFNAFTLWGRDENFPEWASGDILWLTLGMTLTPTEQLRANLSYNRTQVNRPSDGSRVVLSHIPRARVEYQLSRALQLRLITEYVVEEQDDLRDNSRSERPIVFTDGSGGHTLASAYREARMRADTGTTGETPMQTVSRELQQLRDAGVIEFLDDHGTYRLTR